MSTIWVESNLDDGTSSMFEMMRLLCQMHAMSCVLIHGIYTLI